MIDAPLRDVWELVGDPRRYPEWIGEEVLEVTGLPTVEKGAKLEYTARGPLREKESATFEIAELEDLRRIRLECTESGWYSDWKLTEADGGTFADIEIGMQPLNAGYRAIDAISGKRLYRRVANASVDGIKRTVAHTREPASS